MDIFFRIILAFYAFCLAMVSLAMMFITIKPTYISSISDYVLNLFPNRNVLVVIEFIFFVISIVFLFSGFKRDKEKKAVRRFTNFGEIRISLTSIESIALTATRKLSGVKETKASVRKSGDGVYINIRSIALQDVNLPTLMEDIQVRVKKSVEEICGIRVIEVNTSVENVNSSFRSRVE